MRPCKLEKKIPPRIKQRSMNVLNLDNKSPSQALLISQLILVIRTVTPTKEQILYCCLILSISALVKINIRLYRQEDFLLNRFTKDRQSFPKNIYMIYMRGSYSILQFFKDRLEGNLILQETKEVLFPDFYKEKVCVSRICYDYICLKNTRKWVHGL